MKYVNYDVVFREFPDEVTLAVNLSGCPNACPGCHSAYLQGDIGEELTEERLAALLDDKASLITCVGFMGGDADPQAVQRMAAYVKRRWPSLHTGWYSGRHVAAEGAFGGVFDYVKLGPYVSALGPLDAPTTNQRLYRIRPDGYKEDITSRFWKA